jgi:hypothetical protein
MVIDTYTYMYIFIYKYIRIYICAHINTGLFDMVIVTDASCSFDGWHRASSGMHVCIFMSI